jgi:hypothetical protein
MKTKKTKFLILIFLFISCQPTEWSEIDNFIKQSLQESFVIEEYHIAHLPPLVQGYLREASVVGSLYHNNVKFGYKGYFKLGKEGSWLPMDAITYITFGPLSRNWIGEIQAKTGKMSGLDYYHDGKGKMDIRMFPSVPFQISDDINLVRGELVTILAEIVFNPGACINEYIRWEQLSDNSVKATIVDAGLEISGIFYFNDQNLITHFVSTERHLVSDNIEENHPWIATISNYTEYHGVKIPKDFVLTWQLPDREFDYIKASISEIQFNVKNI